MEKLIPRQSYTAEACGKQNTTDSRWRKHTSDRLRFSGDSSGSGLELGQTPSPASTALFFHTPPSRRESIDSSSVSKIPDLSCSYFDRGIFTICKGRAMHANHPACATATYTYVKTRSQALLSLSFFPPLSPGLPFIPHFSLMGTMGAAEYCPF